MNSWVLKIIAMVSMTVDHMGYLLFPEAEWMRMVGRLAFPLYCFLLAEGMRHTSSPKKYLLRLGIFAVLSEVPFDLMAFGRFFDLSGQNVFITLALGLLAMMVWRALDERRAGRLTALVPVILIALAAELFRADYGAYGMALPFVFYLCGSDKKRQAAGFSLAAGVNFALSAAASAGANLYWPAVQLLSLLSLGPILLYNGERGGPAWAKYVFYLFYPLHMLAIYAWRLIFG